jgi:hypothetical protein
MSNTHGDCRKVAFLGLITRALPFALLWLTPACRFGGLEGDAIELIELVEAEDAGEDSDALPPLAPPSSPNYDDDAGAGGGACGPASVLGCDPVRGTSCTPGFNQCVVDPSSPMPAGRCVLSVGSLGGPCDENGLYSTCPPSLTCVQGVCRKYCYCDADCDAGSSCSEPTGQGTAEVFKLCAAVAP